MKVYGTAVTSAINGGLKDHTYTAARFSGATSVFVISSFPNDIHVTVIHTGASSSLTAQTEDQIQVLARPTRLFPDKP